MGKISSHLGEPGGARLKNPPFTRTPLTAATVPGVFVTAGGCLETVSSAIALFGVEISLVALGGDKELRHLAYAAGASYLMKFFLSDWNPQPCHSRNNLFWGSYRESMGSIDSVGMRTERRYMGMACVVSSSYLIL